MSSIRRVPGFREMAVLAICVSTVLGGLAGDGVAKARAGEYRVATFSADVTVPLGHALLFGAGKPAAKIVDPLYARGLVLLGPDKPIVFAAIDWIEVRNDAYDRWRDALADAAGTTRERVLFASVHQHDAPLSVVRGELPVVRVRYELGWRLRSLIQMSV